MGKKVPKGTPVVYATPAGHPGVIDEPGFYTEIDADNDEVETTLGDKAVWVKDKPDPENGQPDPENNEGHFEYADETNQADEEE